MKKCPLCELNYIQDDEESCPVCSPKTTNKKAQSKTFYSMGLKIGDTIEYVFDSKIKATICGEKTVRFEGKEWAITPLMTELGKRTGNKTTFGSGHEVFKYDNTDPNLYWRWERFNQ